MPEVARRAIRAVLEMADVKDGAVLSFHHHLRNGDDVMRQVLAECAAMGLRDLHIAPSSLFPCHAALIPFLREGVVTQITTSYMTGPLADAVREGVLGDPVRLQSHGGRAAAIASGRLSIDVAFVAAPAVDAAGNLSGAAGPSACGPLGYAMVDAAHARHVVALTDHRCDTVPRVCIPAEQVHQVVEMPRIGDAAQIASGTTGRAASQKGLAIAELTAQLIAVPGCLETVSVSDRGRGDLAGCGTGTCATDGGAGRDGRVCRRGITGALVDMFEAGLFRGLRDVQAFDLAAVRSYARDAAHLGMSAEAYASPDRADCIAKQLDVMILGAAEIDAAFNVNVTCASDGRIIGGSGGHADTAAGARLPIVTTPCRRRGGPNLLRR